MKVLTVYLSSFPRTSVPQLFGRDLKDLPLEFDQKISKTLCITERFSDVCYLKYVAMDSKGHVVLFNPNATDQELIPKNITNTITARHDFKTRPNALVRSVRETLDSSKCLYYNDIFTVYFASIAGDHVWHSVHDGVLPFYATILERLSLIETEHQFLEPPQLDVSISEERIRNSQLILHSKSAFAETYYYLLKIFTKHKILHMQDLLLHLDDSKYLCFKDLAVGVSDKANLYFRDEFVKHDRRPIVEKFFNMIYEYYDMLELKPIEWEDKTEPVTVNIISRAHTRSWLNEDKVIDKCNQISEEINIKCQLVKLEEMSKLEQVKLAKTTSILVGIHGNGLSNIMFMNKGAAVIQVYPFASKGDVIWQGTPWFKGENFVIAAQMIVGNYLEWEAPLEKSSLRNQANSPAVQMGKEYWNKEFYKAQKLFLSQSVEMDLDILESLIKEAYTSVVNNNKL